MRIAGVLLLIVALVWLAYALFALAWDGGTARATDDRIMAGFAIALAIGAAGLIARQTWGWWVTGAVAAAIVVVAVLAVLAMQARRPPPATGPVTLQTLPQTDQALAAALTRSWWDTPIDTLRARERAADVIARDWAIQGNDRIRLLVMIDMRRGMQGEVFFSYNVFLLANAPNGTIAHKVFDDFSSDDRAAPVELRFLTQADRSRVVVFGRSSRGCTARAFIVDPAAGTITREPTADAC